jgi:hypothetical protein
MSDMEMHNRLVLIAAIVTPIERVLNRVIQVESDRIIVESERTHEKRTILFRDIQSGKPTANGRIVHSLRQILGLAQPDDHGNSETD